MSEELTFNLEIEHLQRQLEMEQQRRMDAETGRDRALQQLRKRQAESQLLQTVGDAANKAATVDQAMHGALRHICAFANWPIGHVYLLEEGPMPSSLSVGIRYCHIPALPPNYGEIDHQAIFLAGDKLVRNVIEEKKSLWINNVSATKNAAETSLRSLIGFPIIVGHNVAAVLVFFSSQTLAPDENFLSILTYISTQLGYVIERQRSKKAQQRSEEYFRRLTDNSLDLITVMDATGVIQYENKPIKSVFGYDPEHYRGKNAFEFVHPEDVPHVGAAFQEALQKHGNTPMLKFRFRHQDGSWRILEGIGNNLLDDPIVAAIVFNSRDITEREKLEEQFLQSQKVAVVGRLAGGVAHDFNNILTAIIGYSDLVLRELPAKDHLHRNVAEIKKAADRASALTSQLLAFSRKQILSPKTLNLNAVVVDMDSMLRRLIGENINLLTVAHPELGSVKADLGQIEQVIMNLVVNARDAMPHGGRLTIETGNIFLDKDYASLRPEVIPGDYIMLAISDTGYGMDKHVMSHLFEPFFTTKELGQGTGLGLATCHGVVKQSGGHISVYSEVGQGSTFKIYLPRVEGEAEMTIRVVESDVAPTGQEVLLLVEDEPMLRELAGLVLRELGYIVLEAADGNEALRVARENSRQKIDLLISDVVMPEMGGKELAEQLIIDRPETKVLFCSGYTEDAIVHHGVLNAGVHFLQKPFSPTALAQKVRSVLDKEAVPAQ